MSTDQHTARQWISRHLGLVRLRQLADMARHRLSFVPMLYVVGSIAFVQALLWLDGRLTEQAVPAWLTTTVEGARSVFMAIAGGLITSITLLLSMMLITIQLASSQFSPRTLREWLGNRPLQHALGIVLGTTVFCLLALRSTRDFGENETPIVPHVTVLVAVVLGVLSLIAVVQAVDHVTDSLRVESVAKRLAAETISVIERSRSSDDHDPHGRSTASRGGDGGPERVSGRSIEVPPGATPIPAPTSGRIQQIDENVLLAALPERATGYLRASVGSFVVAQSPLLWVAPSVEDDDPCRTSLLDAFALGDTRTSQQDAEFGIIQLTDIAVRALSPGVNDPSTACEIVAHHGAVLTALWQQPTPDDVVHDGTKTIIRHVLTHDDLLRRAIEPILHYGSEDPLVVASIQHMLIDLLAEIRRRDLPGPREPVEQLLHVTRGAG